MSVNEYRTNNRTKIMEYLIASSERTVSVSDIACHMESLNCPVNVTTIYRYLDKLEKDGNVIKYSKDKNGKATYQYVERAHKCEEHIHLKCVKCGSVIHLDCHFMDEITNHIGVEHGFDIQCRDSVIYGICKDCRK